MNLEDYEERRIREELEIKWAQEEKDRGFYAQKMEPGKFYYAIDKNTGKQTIIEIEIMGKLMDSKGIGEPFAKPIGEHCYRLDMYHILGPVTDPDTFENERLNSEQLEKELEQYKKRQILRDGQPVFVHYSGKWRKATVNAKGLSIQGEDFIGNTEGFDLKILSVMVSIGWLDKVRPRSRKLRVIRRQE